MVQGAHRNHRGEMSLSHPRPSFSTTVCVSESHDVFLDFRILCAVCKKLCFPLKNYFKSICITRTLTSS